MFFTVRSSGETCRLLKSGFENNVLFQNVRKSDKWKKKSGVWVDQNVRKLGSVFSQRNKNVWEGFCSLIKLCALVFVLWLCNVLVENQVAPILKTRFRRVSVVGGTSNRVFLAFQVRKRFGINFGEMRFSFGQKNRVLNFDRSLKKVYGRIFGCLSENGPLKVHFLTSIKILVQLRNILTKKKTPRPKMYFIKNLSPHNLFGRWRKRLLQLESLWLPENGLTLSKCSWNLTQILTKTYEKWCKKVNLLLLICKFGRLFGVVGTCNRVFRVRRVRKKLSTEKFFLKLIFGCGVFLFVRMSRNWTNINDILDACEKMDLFKSY